MADAFNECYIDENPWFMTRLTLLDAVCFRNGTAVVGPLAVGNWSQRMIEQAERLEAAAQFLRQTEVMLVESQR